MRCTTCSTRIRPVAAIDIDGTLAGYHRHFVLFAQMYLGHELPMTYDGSREFNEYLGLSKDEYREVKLAYRQGGMKRSMPPYPGGPTFVRWLREQDVEIWIATTRPWLRLDNIDPDTRHWLDRFNVPWDYMIYGEDKYQQLVERVDRKRIVCVVDDLADQLTEAAKVGIPRTYQPERAHNMNRRWMRTFTRFTELEPKVESDIERSGL